MGINRKIFFDSGIIWQIQWVILVDKWWKFTKMENILKKNYKN